MVDPNSPNPEVEAPQAPEEIPESSSPEQDPSEGSSPEGAEAATEEGAEEAQVEDEEGAPEEQPETPKPGAHKRNGYKVKIARLEREKQQLMEMLQRNAPQQPASPQPPKTEQEKAVDDFNALVEQRVEAKLQRERQMHEQQRQAAELQKSMQEARARHADFDDALADVAHIPIPEHVGQAILTSEAKAEIMYRLAKSPAELARISALPPLVAAREIGRLEAKLASGAAPQTPKPAARPPAPPSKVGGSAASTRSLDDLPISEYKRAFRSGRR